MPRFINGNFEEAKEKYLELLEEKKKTGYEKEAVLRELNIECGAVLKDMFDELDDNLEILKRNNSLHVKFGTHVQFFHLESQQFLSFFPNQSSSLEPENLAVGLSDEFSDLTTFKLLPVFNYQASNNGLIFNSDEVYILSCAEEAQGSYDPYLNVSRSVADPHSGIFRKEINMSIEKTASFKINLFSNFLEGFDDNLKVNDVISIVYSELGLHFVSVGYKEIKEQMGYLAITGDTENVGGLTGNSNCMYRIENYDDSAQGGFLEWEKPYKIKHLA